MKKLYTKLLTIVNTRTSFEVVLAVSAFVIGTIVG